MEQGTNGGSMKKFIVYLVVIILTVSLGFGIFYLVRDNEVISISSASIYKDAGDSFTLDVNHINKKSYTEITISSSDDDIVSGRYNKDSSVYQATAHKGGVARINVRTTNSKFRNLWCDVIVGDGSVESPFYISTAEQLAAIGMGRELQDETGKGTGVYAGGEGYERYHSNLCYKLINNIDVSSVNQGFWVPLQNFNGRFDGNGCTISNVYIDAIKYREALGDKADIRFKGDGSSVAGLFAQNGVDGIIYNLKLENYMAVGTYSQFGSVAAVNYGTIERIEVKDAYLSVKTAVVGGIVGSNISTDKLIVVTDESGNEKATYERNVARIDRTSLNMILGQTRTVTPSGQITLSPLGATGTIGGLVGMNKGGTIVYSYVRGEVYFGNDSTSTITYGGVVGVNTAIKGMEYDATDSEESEFQGSSIKDCYSDLKTILTVSPTSVSAFGGAVGINQDFQNGTFEEPKNLLVNNYLIGVYYNKNNLNSVQEGFTKNFKGIGRFMLDEKVVDFAEKETIVYGLTEEEMKDHESFVSHTTYEIKFNEDGTSKGVVQTEVLWLFDTVWTIDADVNDGMPYLNYQLVYIPDDFETVGVPIVASDLDDYYFLIKVDYPVSILSGVDGKVRIKVEEYYQLVYSPTGIEIDWTSSDEAIVTVDGQGKLKGVKAGVATVTAKTKSGSQATITVIVENIPYSIDAPSTFYLYQGETFSVNNIVITPTPTLDNVDYSIANTSIINWIDTATTLKALEVGETKLTIKVAETTAEVKFVVVPAPEVKLTANPSSVSGYINEMSKTGTITITSQSQSSVDFEYTATFISGSGIADINVNGNSINYTIKGVGNGTLRVGIKNAGYTDKGYVDVYFSIKDDVNVTLTMSPSSVSGYYNTMSKTGSVTVSNSAGTTLSYSATSDNTNVVTVSMTGNSVNYTIKGIGTAIVTVKSTTTHYNGVGYIYFTVLENQTVETISLNKTDITLYKGDSYTLTASGNYSSLTWSTTDSSIATVSEGRVSTHKVGNATIIARSGSAEARCIVRVINRPVENGVVSITINPTSKTLNTNSTYNLTTSGSYSSVVWSSSNSSIVSVDSNGKISSGSTTGTAIILASAKDSSGVVRAYAYCTVTVVKQTVITITPSTTIAYVGDTVTFKASTTPSGVTVNWSHSGPATFTKNGNTLTAVTTGKGTLSVSATVGSSSANSTVTVNESSAYSAYIYNLAQLKNIKNHPGKDYYLAANITVGDWTPFNFTGTLTALQNGNSYFYLTDMKVSSTNSKAGLFAQVTGATIKNVIIKNSNIAGSSYAGAIAGSASNSSFNNCKVESSTISGGSYAGGIVGYISTSSVVTNCGATSTNVTANSYAGGIVGYATSSSITTATVNGGSAKMASGKNGYTGGIAGYLTNTRAYDSLVKGSMVIQSQTSGDTNFAGGIAGYTNGNGGSYTQGIESCTVASATVIGYYAGGIAGSLNSSRTYTIKFSEYKSGYRYEDTSNLSYVTCVSKTAVKTGVTVKGVMAGGLFGTIRAGAVVNSYARATVQGVTSGSISAGFAATIRASSSFNNQGGSGSVGLVRYCYSACSFGGSGSAYSITSSLVHNYATFGDGSGRAGYVMNYVFDDGKDGKATYNDGSNIFASDKVKAKKSSSEMQKQGTYTDKGFSSTYWNLSGYPTLKAERS